MERGKRAIIYALLAVMAWSSVAVAFKTGLRYFHYTLFLFLSISVALVIFAGFISLQKKWKLLMQITWRDMLIAMAGGILNPFLYYLVLFKAYSLLPAQMAQSLNYSGLFVLVLLSVPVFGHIYTSSQYLVYLSDLPGFT
jgi:drug/metabolite transporter (DMT)-like permease